MMKRGCRVALVVLPSGEGFVRETLVRFDPGARVAPALEDPGSWNARLAELADEYRVDGVVLPIPVDEYPAARERWGERVLFSPTVGLSDGEVSERWRNVAELAA